MPYLKRNDAKRIWRSFWRHALLLVQPSIAAVVVTFVWSLLYTHGLHLPKADEIVLTSVGVAVPAILFSILAAMLITASYERYQKLTACLLGQDRQTFLTYRDERIPTILHLLQMALSLPIIIVAALLPYSSMVSGGVVVFFTTFTITLYWIAIVELQNPARSPWFAERIPEEWLLADVDELLLVADDGRMVDAL